MENEKSQTPTDKLPREEKQCHWQTEIMRYPKGLGFVRLAFPRAGLGVNGEEGRQLPRLPLGDVDAEEQAKQHLAPHL